MKHTRVLSAAAALLFVATAAQAQRGQNDRRDRQDQRAQVSPPDQRRQGDDDRRGAAESQQRGVEQARAEQARATEMQNQRRAAQEDAQRRDLQSRQREREEQIERAQRAEQEQRLERARRVEQDERLEEAQRRAAVNRAYDRDRDYRSGYDYRYDVGGVYRETNHYGVDVLRHAVDLGYQQGYRAGQTDRRDGAPADFRRAFEYQNGDFGFTGNYVPQSDYSYYFREGFQRGYDDAYWNRARYGTFSNGNPSILSDILSGILGLTSIR